MKNTNNLKNNEIKIENKGVNEMETVVVNKKLKKVMWYEVERDNQSYMINAIATKIGNYGLEFRVIVSKAKDCRACSWNVIYEADFASYTNDCIEMFAEGFVMEELDNIIDFFEEKTDCMYSYDRVKRDIKFWAEECAKEGYSSMHSHFILQMNHITNDEELSEIYNFVKSLNGVSDPMAYYEDYIAE